MIKKPNDRTISVLKWELVQILFCFLYLSVFYFLEMSAANFLGQNNSQILSIHRFLNQLQVNFFPDFFYFLFFPLMLLAIALIVFKKKRWLFLSCTGALIAMLFVADRIYFIYFSSPITTHSFSAAGQIFSVWDAILDSVTFTDICTVIGFSVFFVFGKFFEKRVEMGLPDGKIAFAIDKTMGFLICLLAIYAYNIAFYLPKRYVVISSDHVMRVSKTKIDDSGIMQIVPNYEASNRFYADAFGLMNFHIKNFTDAFKDHFLRRPSPNRPVPESFYAFFEEKSVINEIHSPFYGIGKGRNVFLIHFESLNPAVIELEVGGLPITPTLNQLGRSCFYWKYVLDQVTIGGSSDAEFSSLTGMLPGTETISAFNSSCMPHIPSLPRELKRIGYQTISLHGYDISFWNRNITQPLLGFDFMYFKKAFQYKEKIGMGISDKDFFSQSIDFLNKHTPPIFAFLMTLTSHAPYKGLPPEYQNLFADQIRGDSSLVRYFQAIRYSDDALGDFFSKIKQSGFWENSIFIIYGDHRPGGTTEAMNTALLQYTGKSLLSPRYSCVPLFIIIPGYEDFIMNNKSEYCQVVGGGLYDIFPTIMHLLGESVPFGVFGSNLFVKNSQRDPIPLFRFMDGFVFNGIQYLQQGEKIARDESGYVFTNDANAIIVSDTEKSMKYKKALLSIAYCNYIYATNIDVAKTKPKISPANPVK